jgi:hypothetical protein
VVSATSSNPARHSLPWFSIGKSRSRKQSCRFYPAQQQEIPAQQQAYQPVTKDEYCINTVERQLQNKQKECENPRLILPFGAYSDKSSVVDPDPDSQSGSGLRISELQFLIKKR